MSELNCSAGCNFNNMKDYPNICNINIKVVKVHYAALQLQQNQNAYKSSYNRRNSSDDHRNVIFIQAYFFAQIAIDIKSKSVPTFETDECR